MKSLTATHRLEVLARYYEEKHLSINPEYQRGATWNVRQQRSLIDSILRGFILPVFYVHIVKTPNPFTNSEAETAWLVDGQQRLNAITEFMTGRFALNDPAAAGGGLAMAYERLNPPRWAGKRFDELEMDDQKRFLDHPLTVVRMEEDARNEVRNLFIRLQSGTPLNAQEKRDAWPGDFSLFVIKHAGKDRHRLSSPHPFFDLVKLPANRQGDEDDSIFVDRRSNARKFFAGLAMTYLVRKESELDFVDLKASNLDAFYLNKSDLASDDPGVIAFLKILGEVVQLPEIHRIRDGNKLKFQWAFHFIFLVDSLIAADYVENSWRSKVVGAFEQFRADCAKAVEAFREGRRCPHYTEFVQPLSGSGSDTASTIRRRHQFLLLEIMRSVQPRPRDPQRLFGQIEREIMWYRQGGKCAHPDCDQPTALAEMQAHHVREHTEGGETVTENGVLLCRSCHQNRAEMQTLEPFFRARNGVAQDTDPASDDTAKNENPDAAAPSKLRIEINWPALGKGASPQLLHNEVETDTVVAFCECLVEVFGDEAVRWMTDRPITRFPISKTPHESFKNPVSGNVYTYREIGGTQFFVCTHSSQLDKVRRLQTWVAGLPDPVKAAISIGLERLPG